MYTRKKLLIEGRGKKGNTEREQKEEKERKKIGMKKAEERKTKQTCAQGAGRVPGTRLLFAGTVSPMIQPTDGQLKDAKRRPDGR